MNKIEVGSWNSPQHISIIGEPVCFYIYIKTEMPPWSKWIKGNMDLYYKLKSTRSKNKNKFVEMCKEEFEKLKKNS